MRASGLEEALFSQDIGGGGFISAEQTVEARFGLIPLFSLATLGVSYVNVTREKAAGAGFKGLAGVGAERKLNMEGGVGA